MVNITIYPYGNAQEKQRTSGEWTFTCQHGKLECDANMVETCFINLVDFDQNKYMDFVLDFETQLAANPKQDPYDVAQVLVQNTTNSYNVTWDDLNACIGSNGAQGGDTGNVFEHQMALWTEAANHEYTPWITLNGIHTTAIQNECQDSTLFCTCKQYQGTNACCAKFEEKQPDVCWKEGYKDKKH
eukprot:163189_1